MTQLATAACPTWCQSDERYDASSGTTHPDDFATRHNGPVLTVDRLGDSTLELRLSWVQYDKVEPDDQGFGITVEDGGGRGLDLSVEVAEAVATAMLELVKAAKA